MNTDKSGNTIYSLKKVCFVAGDAANCSKKHFEFVARFFTSLVLSVCICVNPWFQRASFAAPPHLQTLTGTDVLEAENFLPLKGKRVGLVTNQTGIDRH